LTSLDPDDYISTVHASPSRNNWLKWPDLETYAWRLAVASLVGWLVIFGLAFGAVFHWLKVDGSVSWETTLLLCAWSGFFAGLVGYYSSTLQVRKMLILGVVQPQHSECPGPQHPNRIYFWLPALGWAVVTAATQALFMYCLSSFGEGLGYSAGPFLFYTATLPAVSCALLSFHATRHQGKKFLAARLSEMVVKTPLGRYLFLHSVLPYALLSTAVGLITASARFWSEWQGQQLIATSELAEHFAVTVLLVGLILPAAARQKVRVDRLGPMEVIANVNVARFPAYRWWTVIILAGALWAGLRYVISGSLSASQAIAAKGALCFVTAFFFCTLSTAGAWRQEPHPYFALSRRWHEKHQEFLRQIDSLMNLKDK